MITGLSRDAQKLALARELGADAAVDVEREDVVTRVREVTGGGAEVVVDTTPYAPRSLIRRRRHRGSQGPHRRRGSQGSAPDPGPAGRRVIYKELTIRGVLSMPVDETFRAIELIEAGALPVRQDAHPLVSASSRPRTPSMRSPATCPA